MPKGETASQLIGTVLGETFRLERVIGVGGWGAVFEAAHLRLRRRFAIKLLYPEVAAESEALKRFRQEALVTSGLGHPHIVEVVDFNHTDSGSPYIVMELLEGEDLHDRLKRVQRLPLVQVNRLLGQLASALQVAHDSSVVHRDLKPRNVFLANAGHKRDVVKVLDFGISKVLDSATRLTSAEVLMGTPSYMAPEQAEGRIDEVSAATDIWALGALVFKMLTGRPPFIGSSVPQLLDRILTQPAPKVHELASDVPPQISEVVDVALRKRPEERHPSVALFQRAFRRAAGPAGEPHATITEPPPSKHGLTPPPPYGAAVLPAVSRHDAPAPAPASATASASASASASEAATATGAQDHTRPSFPETLRSEPIAPDAKRGVDGGMEAAPTVAMATPAERATPHEAAPPHEHTPLTAGSADTTDKATKQTMNEYGQYVKPRLGGRVLLVLVLLGLAAAGAIATYLAFKR